MNAVAHVARVWCLASLGVTAIATAWFFLFGVVANAFFTFDFGGAFLMLVATGLSATGMWLAWQGARLLDEGPPWLRGRFWLGLVGGSVAPGYALGLLISIGWPAEENQWLWNVGGYGSLAWLLLGVGAFLALWFLRDR